MTKYKNNKMNEIYYSFASAINTTNRNDGEEMVLYINVKDCGIDGNKQVWAREKKEFLEKFTKID